MHPSFEEYGRLLGEQVCAVVEAELLLDPARAARIREIIARGRVAPRVIGCQPAVPERDPSPAALMPMWLVFVLPAPSGDRVFIAYDPERQRFGRGFWEEETAWYRGGSGSFLELVEQLVAEAP
jgi:hypothetical protein